MKLTKTVKINDAISLNCLATAIDNAINRYCDSFYEAMQTLVLSYRNENWILLNRTNDPSNTSSLLEVRANAICKRDSVDTLVVYDSLENPTIAFLLKRVH